MRYYFKVRYEWEPGRTCRACGQPPGIMARSSTVTVGTTKAEVRGRFIADHPHCTVLAVIRMEPVRERVAP